jgi:hypothetical protein
MPTVDRVLPDETEAVIDIPVIPAIPDLPDDPEDGAEPEPRISVIVPALNEAQNLPHVFARLPQVDEIVLVDGGSTDDTVAVARRLRPDIPWSGRTARARETPWPAVSPRPPGTSSS